MKRESFFVLAIIICGIGMTLWALFGSSEQSPEITDTSGSGFTEKLLNTGNTTDSGNIIPVDIPQKNNENTEIKVMMPRYFYNAGWKKFAEDLYTNQKVYMNFYFVDDLNSYRDTLLNNNISDADLFLYPYDRNEEISTRAFTFQQDISPAFDPLISPIIKTSQTTFMPFAADPMIMYILSGYSVQSTFFDIYNFIYDWNPKKPRSFPLFYGITDEDYNNEGFKREYQDIVRYSLMHYFTKYRDSNSLSKRVSNNIFENYKISDLNSISNALTIPECKYFPSICFQIYNFVGIRFGFISDDDIVKQYFKNKYSDFTNLNKKIVPFFTIESPVRLWGRSMPNSLQDNNKINGVYAFLMQYMNNHNQYNLWGATLPVFSDQGDELQYNDYIGMRGYILTSGGNYIEQLRKSKLFRQLINYQIEAEEYIKRA